MNERLSRWVAAWLSHPTGIVQAIATTAAWFAVAFGIGGHSQTAVFWYLAYCTFISYATQFTLAYQNRLSERHNLNQMRLLVALAEEIRANQKAQGAQLDEISEELEELDGR